ncbi:hypothetical protein [Flavobacterium sp.]
MAKIQKKVSRLQFLKECVLECIENRLRDDFDEDNTTIDGECDIIMNSEMIGVVKYQVYQNVLVPSSSGNYFDAPERPEVEFELLSSSVEMLYSNNGSEMPNITKALNEMLFKSEGKILNC